MRQAPPVDRIPDPHWDRLVRFRETSDWPEGSKVEIIGGVVVVSPPPTLSHCRVAERCLRLLYTGMPDDWGGYRALAVAHRPYGLYVPDVVVVPDTDVLAHGTASSVPLAAAHLVAEITTRPDARIDRIDKAAAYASAGVPLYLLIDRFGPAGPTVTLHAEPKNHLYRVLQKEAFGQDIRLPPPFELALDTGVFPVD